MNIHRKVKQFQQIQKFKFSTAARLQFGISLLNGPYWQVQIQQQLLIGIRDKYIKENKSSQQKMISSKLVENVLSRTNNSQSFQNTELGKSYLYDQILDIDSIFNLHSKGWNLFKIKESDDHSKDFRNKYRQIVSVVGNYNKGKTWFLSKLCGRSLPSGYNQQTLGISMIYDKDIAYMDTAGFQMPSLTGNLEKLQIELIKNLIFPDKKQPQDENKKQDNYESLKIKIQNPDINLNNLEEIAFDQEGNKILRQLEQNLWSDRIMIQHLMQKFIIKSSTVIIVLVDQLTLSDQRLISNICRLNQSLEANQQKIVLIVHNFSKINDQESLENQINLDIQNLFNVQKRDITNSSKQNQNSYKNVFFQNKDFSNTFHYVLTKEIEEDKILEQIISNFDRVETETKELLIKENDQYQQNERQRLLLEIQRNLRQTLSDSVKDFYNKISRQQFQIFKEINWKIEGEKYFQEKNIKIDLELDLKEINEIIKQLEHQINLKNEELIQKNFANGFELSIESMKEEFEKDKIFKERELQLNLYRIIRQSIQSFQDELRKNSYLGIPTIEQDIKESICLVNSSKLMINLKLPDIKQHFKYCEEFVDKHCSWAKENGKKIYELQMEIKSFQKKVQESVMQALTKTVQNFYEEINQKYAPEKLNWDQQASIYFQSNQARFKLNFNPPSIMDKLEQLQKQTRNQILQPIKQMKQLHDEEYQKYQDFNQETILSLQDHIRNNLTSNVESFEIGAKFKEFLIQQLRENEILKNEEGNVPSIKLIQTQDSQGTLVVNGTEFQAYKQFSTDYPINKISQFQYDIFGQIHYQGRENSAALYEEVKDNPEDNLLYLEVKCAGFDVNDPVTFTPIEYKTTFINEINQIAVDFLKFELKFQKKISNEVKRDNKWESGYSAIRDFDITIGPIAQSFMSDWRFLQCATKNGIYTRKYTKLRGIY